MFFPVQQVLKSIDKPLYPETICNFLCSVGRVWDNDANSVVFFYYLISRTVQVACSGVQLRNFMCDYKLTVAKLLFLLCLAKSLYAVLSSVAGICVTSPTTHHCTLATAGLHSSMCPPWESLTAVKTWAERCRLSSGRCWSFWTRRRRRSTVSSTSIRLPAGAQPPFYPSPKAKKKNALNHKQPNLFLRYIKKKKKSFYLDKM